jgi:uncharacterized protein involved in exopolysaccharide biosynthesis
MNNQPSEKGMASPLDSVRAIVRIILSSWWILVLSAIIATGGAFAILSLTPPAYESVSIVVLAPLPLKEKKDELSEMMPKNLTVQDYQIVLTSEPVLYKLMERLKSTGAFDKLPPMDEMKDALQAEVKVIKKTANQLEYSSVILLMVRADSAKNAALIANTWAEVAVETSRSHYEYGISGMKDFISKELDKASTDYEEKVTAAAEDVETILKNLNQSNKRKIEELNKFRDEKEKKIAELRKVLNLEYLKSEIIHFDNVLYEQRGSLDRVIVEKNAKKEMVNALGKELEKMPQKIVLNKGLTDTALAIVGTEKGMSEKIPDATIVGEEINEVYITIAEKLSIARSELEAFTMQEQTIKEKISDNEQQYKKVFSDIQDAEYKISELARELEAQEKILEEELDEDVQKMTLLKGWKIKKANEQVEGEQLALSSLRKKYMSSQLAEAGTTPDLKIFSPATAPDQALPRGRAPKSISIGILALILVFFLLLIIEVFKAESVTLRDRKKNL